MVPRLCPLPEALGAALSVRVTTRPGPATRLAPASDETVPSADNADRPSVFPASAAVRACAA